MPSKKKKAKPVEVEEDFDISEIAEFSEEEEEEEELYLDENAEEKIDTYLEGAPAIIVPKSGLGTNDEYPTENHLYCQVKASKTHQEVAPEFNNTLIIRGVKKER